MIIYYSGIDSHKEALYTALENGCRHLMLSYHYKDKYTQQIKRARGLGLHLFLDSGAFSAWNKGVALLLSAITSFTLGDPLAIVMVSAVTFALSETLDTEIFTRVRGTLGRRVLISGAVGGTVDSIVFVIIGLSPLGAGFIPWAAVPLAILGQFIINVHLIGV